MRQYTVGPGDSPASIAASFAGCPKCSRDLVSANPSKRAVVYPNGYLTFEELMEGETINLPEKWFSGALDALPRSYFAALPHADGQSPSSLGALSGAVLDGFASLEEAAARTGALAGAATDAGFSAGIEAAAAALDQSVSGISSTQGAGITRAAVNLARRMKIDLDAAIANGDDTLEIRKSILKTLSDGLVSARQALESPPVLVSAAVTQIASLDPCAPESAAAICAAQAAMGLTPDGKYGDTTAAAVRASNPNAPAGCVPRPSWWLPTGQRNCSGAPSGGGGGGGTAPPADDSSGAIATTAKKGISAGTVAGIGLVVGAVVVGGAILWQKKKKPPAPPTEPRITKRYESRK